MDKRIRELQTQVLPLLNDYLATDREGAIEATRMTIQQLVNLVNANTVKQIAYNGEVNPDNAFGANGDFFYVIPTDDSNLKLYQKVAGLWVLIFDLPLMISPSIDLTFDASYLVEESWSTIDDPAYYLPFDPGLLDPISIKYKLDSEDITNRIDISNIVQDAALTPNFRVGGFTSDAAQTITIKLI